tara:strand:+ start:468 stop:746 length:279 start_codon:yes stop_codon:yes gene_type:complete
MPKSYAWTITHDLLDGDGESVIGPRSTTISHGDIVKNGTKFRMYDDDGTLYYCGFITGDWLGNEPLDDYGTPNAGCTRIDFCENGKWSIAIA